MQLQSPPPPPPESNPPDSGRLQGADCIIFDCDGVLVDVSESYYAAIKETVFFVLNDLPSSRCVLLPDKDDMVNLPIIEKFKNAGRFNDEIDLSCAIILGAAAAMKLHPTGVTPSKYEKVVDDIVDNSASGGIASVISYVQKTTADVSDAVAYMEHPSDDRTGRLCRIFDQIFFGPQIYRQISSRPLDDRIPDDYMMIDRDRTIITERILQSLYEYFNGHVAMVTGRGIYSAKHTLAPLLKYFDVDNSAFLEDEPREYAKPNPAKLLQCIQNMGCKKAVYVGDSAEDAIMASELYCSSAADVIFCGISGTGRHARDRRNILIKKGACMVLDSVLEIPKALNLAV